MGCHGQCHSLYYLNSIKRTLIAKGTPVLSETIEGTEFTKEGLEGETEYTIRVKSIAEGLNDSNGVSSPAQQKL